MGNDAVSEVEKPHYMKKIRPSTEDLEWAFDVIRSVATTPAQYRVADFLLRLKYNWKLDDADDFQ